jgi:hypothetical protein
MTGEQKSVADKDILMGMERLAGITFGDDKNQFQRWQREAACGSSRNKCPLKDFIGAPGGN